MNHQGIEKEQELICRISQLCGFIHEHGFNAYPANRRIRAEMFYSSPDGSFAQWESIEPTWKAVRDWLGY